MLETLIHPPFWAYALALAGVVYLVVLANRRAQRRFLIPAAAIVLLGIAWGLVDHFVQTDLDRAMDRTRQIASAVDRKDWAAFSSLLDPTTGFEIFHNRDQLVKGAKDTAEFIGLRSVAVTSVQGQDQGSLITIDINCVSRVQDFDLDRPIPTYWRFSYARTKDGLVLEHIDALQGNDVTGISVAQIRAQLQK